MKPAGDDVNNDVKPLDEETQRLLDIAPHIVEMITDMWDKAALRKGWKLVVTSIEEKHGVELGTLSREVYTAYRKSNGSEGLQELIKRHPPRQTTIQTPQNTPPATIISLEGPKSSTNQALVPNIAPNIVPNTTPDTAANTTVDVFAAAQKLTDEQAISL